jgi:hypothetical protein
LVGTGLVFTPQGQAQVLSQDLRSLTHRCVSGVYGSSL